MKERILPYPFYHGTSTLFLQSIREQGLGAVNPLSELKVQAFAEVLLPVATMHLGHTDFAVKVSCLERMVQQQSAHMNFQHGDAYLSPSIETAVRYAASNAYGSEYLSTVLDVLLVLYAREASELQALSFEYRDIFELMNVSHAPVLVEVKDILVANLRGEKGEDPTETLKCLDDAQKAKKKGFEIVAQQSNFRLRSPVSPLMQTISLINVTAWNQYLPSFELYQLIPSEMH